MYQTRDPFGDKVIRLNNNPTTKFHESFQNFIEDLDKKMESKPKPIPVVKEKNNDYWEKLDKDIKKIIDTTPPKPVIIPKRINLVFTKDKDICSIHGFPTTRIIFDIKRKWGIEPDGTFIIKANKGVIKFNKFFAPDVNYILETLSLEKEVTVETDKDYLKAAAEGIVKKGWLEEENNLSKKLDYDFGVLDRFTLTPREYQTRFFNHYIENFRKSGYQGCVLAGGVGSGKTYMATALMEIMKVKYVIIVCPKNAVKDIWVNSISGGYDLYNKVHVKSFFKEPRKCWSTVKDNKGKYLTIAEDTKYFIFHYEKMAEVYNFIEGKGKENVGIILDEGHNCTEPGSVRTSNFINLCKLTGSQNIVWLSATPIKAKAKEVMPILKTLAVDFKGDVEKEYNVSYCGTNEDVLDIVAKRFESMAFIVNRNEYMTLPEPIEKDIQIVLPEKLSNRFLIESVRAAIKKHSLKLAPHYLNENNKFVTHVKERIFEYKKHHNSIADNTAYMKYFEGLNEIRNCFDKDSTLDDDDFDAMESDVKYDRWNNMIAGDAKLMKEHNEARRRLSQVKRYCKNYENKVCDYFGYKGEKRKHFNKCCKIVKNPKRHLAGVLVGTFYSQRRIKCFSNLAKNLNWEEILSQGETKALVFSDYIEPADVAYKLLSNMGLRTCVVHSKIKDQYKKDVDMELQNFRYNHECLIMSTTFKSLGASKSMTQADKVILLDQSFRDYIRKQAIGRIDRDGQIHVPRVFNAYLNTGDDENLSTRTLNINQWNKEVSDIITGSKIRVKKITF